MTHTALIPPRPKKGGKLSYCSTDELFAEFLRLLKSHDLEKGR